MDIYCSYIQKGWLRILLNLFTLPIILGSVMIEVNNDSPAVLEFPIQFNVSLKWFNQPKPSNLVYIFKWLSQSGYEYKVSNLTQATNYSFLFVPITNTMEEQQSMLITVKSGNKTLATDSSLYQVLSRFELFINIYQNSRLLGGDVVKLSSKQPTLIQTVARDPHNYLRYATHSIYSLFYDKNILKHPNNTFIVNFTSVRQFAMLAQVMAYFNGSGNVYESVKVGTNWTMIEVDDPISSLRLSGNTVLGSGALIMLTANYDGTPPWSYCFLTHVGIVNSTDNETCPTNRLVHTRSNVTEFRRYLPNNNTYTVVLIVSNSVSVRKTQATVVVSVKRQIQLSYYLVPFGCALLAFVFIIFGSIQFLKSRRDYNLEVADFDLAPIDNMQEMSIWSRIHSSVHRPQFITSFITQPSIVQSLFTARSSAQSQCRINYGTLD